MPITPKSISIFMKCIDITFATKSTAVYGDVFNVVQTLGAGNLLGPEQASKIVKHLFELTSATKNETMIYKILQVLIAIINKSTVMAVCPMTLDISLKIFSINDPTVQNTTLSILKCMYSLLFSLLTVQDVEGQNSETFQQCYDQLKILQRTIGSARDTRHKIIAMDVFYVVFAEHGATLVRSSQIFSHVTQPLLPVLCKHLQTPSIPLGLLVHVVNLSVKLVLSYSKYYELLLPITKWESSGALWLRYFALEAIGLVLASPSQISALFASTNAEAGCSTLKLLVDSVERVVERANPKEGPANEKLLFVGDDKVLADVGRWGAVKPPEVGQGQFLWLSVSVVAALAKSLEELCSEEKVDVHEPVENSFTPTQLKAVVDPVKEVWKTVYSLLMTLLKESKGGNNLLKVTAAFRSFIKVLAAAKLLVPMNTVMQSISKFALPLKIRTFLQHIGPYIDYSNAEHLQGIKGESIILCNVIVNIALNLNCRFNQKTWVIVFGVLQKLSILIFSFEYEKCLRTPNAIYAGIVNTRVEEYFGRKRERVVIGINGLEEIESEYCLRKDYTPSSNFHHYR